MNDTSTNLRVQYASDIHLEFRENFQYIKTGPFEATGDMLVLAGDSFYLNDTTLPKTNFGSGHQRIYRKLKNKHL